METSPSPWSKAGACRSVLCCYQTHLSVCVGCSASCKSECQPKKRQKKKPNSSSAGVCRTGKANVPSPTEPNIMWGTRPTLLLGQHDLQCEKAKPKSPSNENIKVNASQVRNLLPLTPINSYKTLVLSCPYTGTQIQDFIKLNFLFFFMRSVMCVWANHHLPLSRLVHFPGLWKAEGTSILFHGTWYRQMKWQSLGDMQLSSALWVYLKVPTIYV